MRTKVLLAMAAAAILMVGAMAGCGNQDSAPSSLGDAVSEAASTAGDMMSNAGNAMESAASQAQDNMQSAMSGTGAASGVSSTASAMQ